MEKALYDRLLDCFHSSGINLHVLTAQWAKLIMRCCSRFLLVVNDRFVLLGDGLKTSKAGKKMPAVKRLFQESESNTKPQYIFGHSCQAIAIVAVAMRNVLPEFLGVSDREQILAKFIRNRVDVERSEGLALVA